MLLALLAACSSPESQPQHRTDRPADEQAALGGAIAARVGGEPIPLSLVAAVANAQHIPAKDALRKIVDDEIAANAAKKRGLDQKDPTSWNLTAVRGRLAADRLLAEAKKQGPPSNAEVERLSELHWADVDRPPMVHVIHAIARRPDKPALVAEARAIGEQIAAAVKDASSAEDFKAKATAVAHPKEIETRVEDLPPFTEEGRVATGGGMDPAFARPAYALKSPGDQTGIVETSFGWHVIRLIERIPEQRMAFEDRRTAFAEEVLAMRGHDAVTELLTALKRKTRIEVSPAAEQLMRSVSIGEQQASRE